MKLNEVDKNLLNSLIVKKNKKNKNLNHNRNPN